MTEIAVGLEFANIPALTIARLLGFHRRVSEQLPTLIEQMPLPASPPLRGTLLAGVAIPPQFQFGIISTPTIRSWMLSGDENLLLQLQQDRMVLNWRRASGNAAYPSYDTLEGLFGEFWGEFINHLEECGVSPARPLIADVTFVNRIGKALRADAMHQVLTTASRTEALSPIVRSTMEHIIDVSRADRGAGQCVVTAVADVDDADASTLTISTRVATTRDALTFETFSADLRYAHDVGVRAFSATTTEDVQRDQWGLIK